MKDLDPKSLIIGILATALLFACADTDKTLPSLVSEAKAATGVNDKWDANQQWDTTWGSLLITDDGSLEKGWEPFAVTKEGPLLGEVRTWYRKRVK